MSQDKDAQESSPEAVTAPPGGKFDSKLAKKHAKSQRPMVAGTDELVPIFSTPKSLSAVIGEAGSGYFALAMWLVVFGGLMQLCFLQAVIDNSTSSDGYADEGSQAARAIRFSLANHKAYDYSTAQWWMQMLIVFVLLLGMSCLRVFVVSFGQRANAAALTPSDYAMHITGLPTQADKFSEDDLREYFSKFGKVHSVAISFQVGELMHAEQTLAQKSKKRIRLGRIIKKKGEDYTARDGMNLCKEPVTRTLERTRGEESEALEALKQTAGRPETKRPSGHAVITFETPKGALVCFKELGGAASIFSSCTSSAKKFMGKYRLRAAVPDGEPQDIYWENLQYSYSYRVKRSIVTWCKSTVAMMLAAGVMVVCAIVKHNLTSSCTGSNDVQCSLVGITLLTAIPSVIVTLASFRTFSLISAYARTEKHPTASAYLASVIGKSSTAHLILSGAVLLAIYSNPANWWKRGNLVDQAFYNLLSDAILPPIKNAVTLVVLRMRNIRKEAPYAESQEEFNEIHELGEWSPSVALSALTNLFCLTLVIAPVLPVAWLIFIGGVFFQTVMNRYIVLRMSKTPHFFSISLVVSVVNEMQQTVFWYLVGISYIYGRTAGSGVDRDVMSPLILAWFIWLAIYIIPFRRCLSCADRFRNDSVTAEDENVPFDTIASAPYNAPNPFQIEENAAQLLERSKKGIGNSDGEIETMNALVVGAGAAMNASSANLGGAGMNEV